MKKVKYAILGAGIAGLAAANELDKANTIVFEANDYTGGLCHSFTIEGFTFDTAVHLSFTENDEVRQKFDLADYYIHQPIAHNYFHGYWLKHPVINNLYKLPVNEKVKYIKDFIERKQDIEIDNYADWLRASYGESLYNQFYKVYTKKYWGVEPERMSVTWLGNRLTAPDLGKILFGAFSSDTGNDYYAKEMRYPKSGGFQKFIKSLENDIDIRLNMQAVKIDKDKNLLYFENGEVYGFDILISSVPLPAIINMMDNVPKSVECAASRLIASEVSLISVGIKGQTNLNDIWDYIYDEEILASRIYSPNKKSIHNVPNGCSSVQFEIYHNPNAPKPSKDELLDNVKMSIQKMNICENKDILFMDYRHIPYGNVIFYNGMEKDREIVSSFLADNQVISIGRFGEWKYYWSDESYLSGKKCIRILTENCKV